MSEEPTRSNPDESDIPNAPAQWERRTPKDLNQELSGGSESYEMEATEGQAGHLASSGQSLDSKLHGGGMDQATGEQAFSGMKLCPACNAVANFSQGVCANCQYRLGETVHAAPGTAQSLSMSLQGGGKKMVDADAPAFTYAAPASTGSGKRIALIIVIALVLIGGAITAWTLLQSSDEEEAPVIAGSVEPIVSHAGTLSEVIIDDDLRAKLGDSLNAASDAWKAAGVDCYVFRFDVFSHVDAATSQSISVTAFCGGTEVEQGITDQIEVFNLAVKPQLDELHSHAGVSAIITPTIPTERDVPGVTDVYLRYGYDYGLENIKELQAIIDGLDAYKTNQGQYPMSLPKSITQPPIYTSGTYKHVANGFGYLPIYRTDSAGNILFGEGGWRESNTPLEVTGYYVFWFGRTQNEGLDFLSLDNIQYMDDHYWFPYEVTGKIRNVQLESDGRPDGIMCVVHNGELLRLE